MQHPSTSCRGLMPGNFAAVTMATRKHPERPRLNIAVLFTVKSGIFRTLLGVLGYSRPYKTQSQEEPTADGGLPPLFCLATALFVTNFVHCYYYCIALTLLLCACFHPPTRT